MIEAVTGSGKTDVAIVAAADALRRGRFVLVVVPSRVSMEQWYRRLGAALPTARIGRLGDSGKDDPGACDVLVTTRHSAAAHKPVPPGSAGGLLVADECHGLGGGILRRAMLPQYDERLGLTATLERSDDAVTELLIPYFGGICHRYGFEQAIADGVCAAPRVAFVGVELTAGERVEYTATEQALVSARLHLRRVRGMPLEPFGDFLAAVARISRSVMRESTVAPRASTSSRSPSDGRSWRSRAGNTSCSAAWRRQSVARTVLWCSPRPCAPRTTPSTGWIPWCRST